MLQKHGIKINLDVGKSLLELYWAVIGILILFTPLPLSVAYWCEHALKGFNVSKNDNNKCCRQIVMAKGFCKLNK